MLRRPGTAGSLSARQVREGRGQAGPALRFKGQAPPNSLMDSRATWLYGDTGW